MFALIAAVAAAQVRGSARIAGKIVDDQDAGGRRRNQRRQEGRIDGPSAKSNAKGSGPFQGMAAGEWNLEIVKAGFDPHRITVQVSEMDRIRPST
jgi:hypothetical protein